MYFLQDFSKSKSFAVLDIEETMLAISDIVSDYYNSDFADLCIFQVVRYLGIDLDFWLHDE